jgi:hypothetical protein
MKNLKSFFLFALLFLWYMQGYSQQNPVWSLPSHKLNHLTTTLTPLPLGPDIYVDYQGEEAENSHNAFYDANNELLFFIVDHKVYDGEGYFIDDIRYNYSWAIKGTTETLIIPDPENCSRYYIVLAGRYNYGNINENNLPYLAILDFNEPNIHYANLNKYGALVKYYNSSNQVISTTISLETLMPNPFYFQPTGPMNAHYGNLFMAASKLRDDNTRLLFISNGMGIYRFIVDNNGVSFDDEGGGFIQFPFSEGATSFRSEMELIEIENGNYRIAVPYLYNNPNNLPHKHAIYTATLDTDGQLISNSEYIILFELSLSNTKPYPRGLEFSPNGKILYITHLKAQYNLNPIQYLDFNNLNSGLQTLGVNDADDFQYSFIEMGYDGTNYKLYLVGQDGNGVGNRLATLSDPNNPDVNNWTDYYEYINFNANHEGLSANSIYRAFILPDQIDGMDYKAHFFVTTECCVQNKKMDIDKYTVTAGNHHWTNSSNPFGNASTVKVREYIELEPGAQLTIQNMKFEFAPGAKVIVKRGNVYAYIKGAILELRNSIFTLFDECGDELWEGVEVEGFPTLTQLPIYNTFQARLSMFENSMIEHAKIGAKNYSASKTFGGIIRVEDNSIFKDNIVGIELSNYKNRHPTQHYQVPTISMVINSDFIITDEFKKRNQNYPIGIALYNTDLKVLGSRFENTHPSLFDEFYEGCGILSWNSDLNVEQVPFFYSHIPSEFKNLEYGIVFLAIDKTKKLLNKWTQYDNNKTGVFLASSTFSEVTNNNFIVKGVDDAIGLYLTNSTHYKVQENSFESLNYHSAEPDNIGIVVNNSGADYNLIRRNYFQNLGIGVNAQDINANYENVFGTGPINNRGLLIMCNTFEQDIKEYDIGNVGVYGRIMRWQAGEKSPAGNLFSYSHEGTYPDHYDYVNYGQSGADIIYYHHETSSSYSVFPKKTDFTHLDGISLEDTQITMNDFDESCPRDPRVDLTPHIPFVWVSLNDLLTRKSLVKSNFVEESELLDFGNSDSLMSGDVLSHFIDRYDLYINNHITELEEPEYLSRTVLNYWLQDDSIKNYIEISIDKHLSTFLLNIGHIDSAIIDLLTSENYSSTVISNVSIALGNNEELIELGNNKYEEFYSSLANLKKEIAEAEIDLVHYYQNDTTGDYHVMEEIQQIMEEVHSQISLSSQAFVYANLNDFAKADSCRSLLPSGDYKKYLGDILSYLSTGNLDSVLLDSTVYSELAFYSDPSKAESRVSESASHVLNFINNTIPQPLIIRGKTSNKKERDRKKPSDKVEEAELVNILNENIKIYPNPANNQLNISYELLENENAVIQIFDFMGREIKSQNLKETQGIVQIDIQDLSNGNYLLRISDNGKLLKTEKVVVKR